MSEPHPDWPKTLEWIEAQAQASLKSRFATAELVAKEVQTTLTVLLAAVGGSAAFAARIFDPGPPGPIVVAAAAVCVYLVTLAVLLVVLCMMFQSYPALYQEPKNLMHPEYSLSEIRKAELDKIQERIDDAAGINVKRAKRLNSVRIAAALTPVLFAVVAVCAPTTPAPEAEKTILRCNIGPAASDAAAPVFCEIVK